MFTPDRLRAFFDAWNAHDVEAIISYFTPDGAYYASIGPDDAGTAFHGTDELRRGVAAFLAGYLAAGMTETPLSHDETLAGAARAAQSMTRLIENFLQDLTHDG